MQRTPRSSIDNKSFLAVRAVFAIFLICDSSNIIFRLMLHSVLTGLAAMNSHQRFLPAWKPMLMCVISISIA
jgi:hypothetical protein